MEIAASSQQEAIYKKLPAVSDKDVRLIVLSPGTNNDPIACDLIVAPLTHGYEALSYTWGLAASRPDVASVDDEDEWEEQDEATEQLEALTSSGTTIAVNGHPLNVMPNLHQALRHLRDATSTRTLWVDYVCINQGDVEDRNAQVARMDSIFREATRVVIWLGLESPSCAQAVEELLRVATNIHLSAIYPGTVEETRVRIRALVELLDRSWFFRVWVVQEVAVSREAIVQLGKTTVPWEFFLQAASVYRDHYLTCCAAVMSPFIDASSDDFLALKLALASVLAMHREALPEMSLHMALRLYYDRLATDPRDKVFALLGLLRGDARLVRADYAQGAREVFEDVALKIIQDSGSLSVFVDFDEYAGDVETASWAPDWTTSASIGMECYDFFKAAGGLRADARICSAHTLKLSGLIFDHVTEVEPHSPEEGKLLTACHRLKAWEDLAGPDVDGPSPYSSSEAREDAFWQTAMMGMSADRSRRVHEDDRSKYDAWRHWLERYDTSRDRQAFFQATSMDESINQHNNNISFFSENRRFFLTKDGYFGLGPVEMKADDDVCVLFGGTVPFILRAIDETCDTCDNGQYCYRLLGFAYVHGIMDGETVRDIEADEAVGIEFCLR